MPGIEIPSWIALIFLGLIVLFWLSPLFLHFLVYIRAQSKEIKRNYLIASIAVALQSILSISVIALGYNFDQFAIYIKTMGILSYFAFFVALIFSILGYKKIRNLKEEKIKGKALSALELLVIVTLLLLTWIVRLIIQA